MDSQMGPPGNAFSQEMYPTQCTQGAMDPRRLGRNNSGLSDADISDVICILHPCSPAAFQIVARTAERSPHNVLQNDGFAEYDDELTQSMLEEQETFILNTEGSNQAMDLALRFSTEVISPTLGFVFGRNQKTCDIALAQDTYKRVSNMHFSMFMNDSGVLMLQDMSTNGTMVDDVVLKGKIVQQPQTRMLSPGSIIQILSPKSEEIVKFIVRIPAREGHEAQFEAKFGRYLQRRAHARAFADRQGNMPANKIAAADLAPQSAAGSYKATIMSHNHTYGMHWSGGEKYNVVGCIGKGAFATVYQLATKREGQLYAAKELEKRKFMKNGVLDRKLDNEMQIMKAISHPNIVQYVDYQDHANHLYIIMEFVPCGDLQQYLGEHGALSEPLGKTMSAQVLNSLAYLHAKKITHRDIKPDNILIADMDPNHFIVKLSDFGLSKVITDNDTFLKTFCGTLLYCAPEVFPHYDAHVAGRGQKRTRKGPSQPPTKYHSYSQSVDIWSFGAVLWFALSRLPPFEGVADATGRGMFDKIMMTPLDHGDLTRQEISADAIDLLVAMLNTDPAGRPSPRTCLSHKWFDDGEKTSQVQQLQPGMAPPLGMFAIYEEEEAELPADPDLSQLSLGQQGDDGPDSQDSHYADEASIHSGSMQFFDPRQSKRFKSEAFAYREYTVDLVDSSPELMHQHIPIVLQQDIPAAGPPQSSAPPKLFGEISQSLLADPAMFVAQPVAADDRVDLPLEESGVHPAGAIASPSLLGAESLMRDVHMHSPQSADSPVGDPNEPATPKTPSMPNGSVTRTSTNHVEDETPKQPQLPVFNRQIELPIPASLFWDAHDESTHNADYASRISGFDYSANKSYVFRTDLSHNSLPQTNSGSATEHDADEPDGDTDAEADAGTHPEHSMMPPPPRSGRLGRLIPTPNSFSRITLMLDERVTEWGRLPANTHVYEPSDDNRVPRRAFMITFHREDKDEMPANTDWTTLDNLYCAIQADSKWGIRVNGVKLTKGEPGTTKFGRLYTGDEITVYPPGKNGEQGLSFLCDFAVGQGKQHRPVNVESKQPRFKIETDSEIDALGSQLKRRARSKSKGKEKENVGVQDDQVAVN
ncbi:Protein kinase protein rad53 [Recurvomyces mirabilis]|uniref:non-specific serine/threonine protein kinase n=1 Tax=Recurvomyces mirabilis TaxID=574656 RepID=A0AAE1C2B8_9PEZI|nr:Protein kinase protein rad53 [Recurvomyces mirabilis]KAK5152921.1 Protein kinase protein rad53 [Recurvomyces mirabilis]